MTATNKDTSQSTTPQEDNQSSGTHSRKSVSEWNSPLFSQEDKQWYSPKFWVLLIADIVLMVVWFFWHRYQSAKADRWVINHNITYALQEAHVMRRDDDLTKAQQRSLERIESSLDDIADELNIQSDALERERRGSQPDKNND